MSNTIENGITIEISGEADSGKTLVGSICHKALSKAGFTNVTMTDQQGELVEPYEPRTVLDLVAQKRPELFATPIGIVEVTDSGEEVIEVVELSDMTLRLGDDDEPDPMSEVLAELRESDDNEEVAREAD